MLCTCSDGSATTRPRSHSRPKCTCWTMIWACRSARPGLRSWRLRIFGIDPDEDRLRIRALRAMPPMRAAHDDERRQVFSAALGQFDELLTAAASVGPASRPLPLYYALNQAGRAIVAALQPADRPWEPRGDGLSIPGSEDARLQGTMIAPAPRPGSFQLLAEAINAPVLTSETALSNVGQQYPGSTNSPDLAPVARAGSHLRSMVRRRPCSDRCGISIGFRPTNRRNPAYSSTSKRRTRGAGKVSSLRRSRTTTRTEWRQRRPWSAGRIRTGAHARSTQRRRVTYGRRASG